MACTYANQQKVGAGHRKSLQSQRLILIGMLFFCQYGRATLLATEPLKIDFNPMFIHGSGIDVTRFSERNPVLPGNYDAMVRVNGQLRGRQNIRFITPPNQSSAEACLTSEQLKQLGIKITDIVSNVADCMFIERWVAQSSSHYIAGDFELNLQVPQLNIVAVPRGYIDPSLWQVGETVGFLDYSSNIYSQFQRENNGGARNNVYNGNLSLFSGFNYEGWRLRNRMNMAWSTGSSPQSQSLYGFVSHDVTALNSQLLLGETNTQGDLFESYSMRGVVLQSEERMLPDSLRVYTPVVRGIAETNARVKLMQRGLTIYEIVVPPGPFELNDIGTMGYGGDLLLVVTESDGRQRRQNIPFSAPPMLLHEKVANFSLSAGQLRDRTVSQHPAILQGSYRYGLLNDWTLYAGGQIAQKYRALGVGNAINTSLGGVSFDVTRAQSARHNGELASGNSYQMNFTKYLGSTDTNLTLAAYRYSSSGFYTFREASQVGAGSGGKRDSTDSRTRHRFSATLSQRVNDNISLNFNGSLYSWWGDRGDSHQYSMTFNHALQRFSYGFTAMRTYDENRRDENSMLLSISMPLGVQTINSKPLFSSLYSSVSHSGSGNMQFQTIANGSQGKQSELTYGIGAAGSNSSEGQRDRSLSGNVNYRGGPGQLGATASVNNRYAQQLSLSAAGSVVAHPGGITAGPSIGDAPFAIVGAKGAKGARLLNGYGSKVDANGYAIMPSLTPYRENLVALDGRGLPDSVDVLGNEKRVVPRQGAAIAIDMQTISGVPMVLTLRDQQGEFLPIGSALQSADSSDQSVVAQGGQAFIRGWQPDKQPLYAHVTGEKLRCVPLEPAMPLQDMNILQLEVICSRNGN